MLVWWNMSWSDGKNLSTSGQFGWVSIGKMLIRHLSLNQMSYPKNYLQQMCRNYRSLIACGSHGNSSTCPCLCVSEKELAHYPNLLRISYIYFPVIMPESFSYLCDQCFDILYMSHMSASKASKERGTQESSLGRLAGILGRLELLPFKWRNK